MFQADGQEDGVHRPGMGHVNPGAGMHFGPVKEAVKRQIPVFITQVSLFSTAPVSLLLRPSYLYHSYPIHCPLSFVSLFLGNYIQVERSQIFNYGYEFPT